jgi:hypothetical protein
MFRAGIGTTGLYQIVFAKGRRSPQTYPMTRAFLYQELSQREPQTAWRQPRRHVA